MGREEFISIYEKYIDRKGADKLLEWLDKSDFFKAPASTKFHLATEGGLCTHSVNVYKRLKALVENEYEGEEVFSDEVIAVCGLLHDVCKANCYKQEMRNVKVNGIWEQKPFYTFDEQLPFGHGEKSVFIIERFMRLKLEEAIAIRYHMGGFSVIPGDYSLSKAFEQYPLAVLTHVADLTATYLDEAETLEKQFN